MEKFHIAEKLSYNQLTYNETYLLEAELINHIYDNYLEIINYENLIFSKSVGITAKMENDMQENVFLKYIINDIILTGEYSIEGLAYHIRAHEDVLYDIVSGINLSPSLNISKKIIGVHMTVRPNIYKEIIKKAFNSQ